MEMGHSVSRNIPEPIKREVRQRCGFGCVICGVPYYHYDHIQPFAEVQEHDPANITLLCSKHHDEKTRGLMPNNVVIEANAHPHNIQKGISTPQSLYYSGVDCEVVIGGNSFYVPDLQNNMPLVPVMIDNFAALAFILTDDYLLLSLFLFDEYNKPVLKIVNNELVLFPTSWDITFKGSNLIIQEQLGKFLTDITFDTPNRVVINRGRFLLNGVELIVRPDSLFCNDGSDGGIALSNCVIECQFGIVLGFYSWGFPCAVRIENISRYSQGS